MSFYNPAQRVVIEETDVLEREFIVRCARCGRDGTISVGLWLDNVGDAPLVCPSCNAAYLQAKATAAAPSTATDTEGESAV